MTDKEKIREEVERIINRRLNLVNGDYFDLNEETSGLTNEILDIIGSLQEEPVNEDLEEAAQFYADTHTEWFDADGNPHVVPAFKAGAKWGINKAKVEIQVQSTVNAVDAHCFGFFLGNALFCFRLPADNYLVGSEVKVIIIK